MSCQFALQAIRKAFPLARVKCGGMEGPEFRALVVNEALRLVQWGKR